MNDVILRSTRRTCALFAGLLILSAGCVRPPTEKPVYAEARRAIEAFEGFPASAKVLPIDESELFIGKSAARADLKVETQDPGGAVVEKRFTVQLKRVARTWVAHDVGPTPGT